MAALSPPHPPNDPDLEIKVKKGKYGSPILPVYAVYVLYMSLTLWVQEADISTDHSWPLCAKKWTYPTGYRKQSVSCVIF